MSVTTNFVIICSDCGRQLTIPVKPGILTKDETTHYIKKKIKKLYNATHNEDTDHTVCGNCKPITRRKPSWAK